MICWNRFISYIYRYHRNEKCENTGFAKVQKISGNGRIQIGLKDIVERRDGTYLVYIYRETLASDDADHETVIPKLKLLGKLSMRGGRGEGTFTFDWNNVMESGRPMTAWNGLLIEQAESGQSGYVGSKDIFCSSWTDNHIDYARAFEEDVEAQPAEFILDTEEQSAEALVDVEVPSVEVLEENDVESSVEIEAEMVQEVLNADVDKIEAALEIAEETVASAGVLEQQSADYEETDYDNPAEEILATHEKLPLLPAYDRVSGRHAEIFECVKITPNDIGLLDMENWRLGVNSFLTHGFYHYQYLMFGRVVFHEGEMSHSYILGVPGVYSSKEKYLADIFGFDRFVPSQETMVKTGSFGYWIIDIKN